MRCRDARPSAARSFPTCRASGCPRPGRRRRTRPRPRGGPRRPRTRAGPNRPHSHQVGAAGLRRHLRVPAQVRRDDERLGFAVLHDVAGLVAGQVPVDRGEPEARPVGRVEHLDELGPVGAHEGHGVTGAKPAGAEGPGQPVHVGVELAEGPVTGRADQRRPFGTRAAHQAWSMPAAAAAPFSSGTLTGPRPRPSRPVPRPTRLRRAAGAARPTAAPRSG